MDALDILGGLLGKKLNSGGSGGNILKDILGGKPKQQQPSQPSQPSQPRQAPPSSRPTVDSQTLEEMLGVANDRHTQRRQEPQASAPQFSPKEEAMNEQSKILVCAMVNAAKSDGQIDREEQENILKQFDHVTQEEAQFLRSEFQKELDVREFAWNVPLGMEENVYAVSLIAMDLDENKEATYLAELAQGLRLRPEVCNAIHRKFNAPEIFRA